MPLPTLDIPPFPDVPNLPGVPPLLRSGSFTPEAPTFEASDSAQLGAAPAQEWGIYDAGGAPAIVADSFLGIEFMQEYRVSNYPQQRGAFASYNKVQVPFQPRVSFAKGGTQAERQAFLQQIEAAIATTDLYSVVTPEWTYASVTLTRYDYTRSSNGGAGLMTVNIWCEQVRETGSQVFRQTATPEGVETANTGPVQPTSSSAADDALLNSLLDEIEAEQ